MKYAWIEQHRDRFSVARMCRQLAVSRTGYCQWRDRVPSPRAQALATLDARVAAIHADRQRRYGRPRILRELLAQGHPVGHERVHRSLNRQGLRPVQLFYDTRAQARLDIVDWIEGFYNRDRMHSAIHYQTPAAAEASLIAA